MRVKLALLVVVAVAAAACGSGAGTDTTVPADPDAVVLSVTSVGGFMPIEFNLDQMPRYVVTADRTLYFTGPTPEIWPPPLLPNVRVATIAEADWKEVMALLDDLGIVGIGEDFIDLPEGQVIADAPTDFINYYTDGEAHRMGFVALEFSMGTPSTERTLARELLEILGEVSNGDSTEYAPTRLQVAAGPALPDEQGVSTVEPWPLVTALADMDEWAVGWRCVEIDDDAVPGLMTVFKAANMMTLWDTGSEQVSIKARPLLPSEVGCEGIPGS